MYKKKQKNVKKFCKKFNTRLIRAKNPYSIEEITELLHVNKSAVGRWLKAGLCKIDDQQPYLIWGQELIDFLNQRNQSNKRPCADDQLFCCKCQKATRPKDNTVRINISNKRTNLIGKCVICGSSTNRTISPQNIDVFRKKFTITELVQENLIKCGNSSAIATKTQEMKND
jgi:hypothetical protein